MSRVSVLCCLATIGLVLGVPFDAKDLNKSKDSQKNIVCYFTGSSVYRPGKGNFDVDDIDPLLCTHINFNFIGLESDGRINILDAWESSTPGGYEGFHHLVELKEKNPNLKILVSMGGKDEQSNIYSGVADNSNLRKNLANNVLAFLQQWSFDGFDLDWQYPGLIGGDPSIDKKNYVLLLNDISEVIKPKGYLLTVTVSGTVKTVHTSYDVVDISKTVDYMNVMTYEFHDPEEYNYVYHSSALYGSSLDASTDTGNVNSSIQYWLSQGADPQKLNLGIITYGRTFTLASSGTPILHAHTNGKGKPGPYSQEAGILAYNEICEFHSTTDYIWDDEQKVPHRTWDDQWVGFEDEKSIQFKTQYVLDNNLAGVMVWTFDFDDFGGNCGDKYPLINAIKNGLNQ